MPDYMKSLEKRVEDVQNDLANKEKFIDDLLEFSFNFLGDTQDEMSITDKFESYFKDNKYKNKDVKKFWRELIQKMGEKTEKTYGGDAIDDDIL